MRLMRFLVAVVSFGIGVAAARAEGSSAPTSKSTALPPAQPSVVVTLERGVRVWRPVSESVDERYSQPSYQAPADAPFRQAAPTSYEAPYGYGAYGYGGYGNYGSGAYGYGVQSGYGNSYGVGRQGGKFGVAVGRPLANRYPVIGGGHRLHGVINQHGPAPYGNHVQSHVFYSGRAAVQSAAGYNHGHPVKGHSSGRGHHR